MPASRPGPGNSGAAPAAGRVSSLDSPRALVAGSDLAPRVVPIVPPPTGAAAAAGQSLQDLLLLGALACQTPVALLSVPQSDGTWSSLSHGFETRDGLNHGQLFDLLSTRNEPFEIVDMVTSAGSSPLIHPPHSMRWAYGMALRGETGALLGVVAVMDRWLRQLTKREQRAMVALGRQVSGHLAGLRRPAPPAFTPVGVRQANQPPVAMPAGGATAGMQVERPAGPAGPGVPEGHHLLRSHEVAVMFDVTERTVINWAAAGKLPSLRTMGGHLRFRREDVLRLLAGASQAGA